MGEWEQLVREFGARQFKRGMRFIRQNSTFFPKPKEIRDAILTESNRVAEYAHTNKHECPDCDGTRFKPVPGKNQVQRCNCRRVEQDQKSQAAGEKQ